MLDVPANARLRVGAALVHARVPLPVTASDPAQKSDGPVLEKLTSACLGDACMSPSGQFVLTSAPSGSLLCWFCWFHIDFISVVLAGPLLVWSLDTGEPVARLAQVLRLL